MILSLSIEKEKYGFNKIKARGKHSEIAWIFFGAHTANAVSMIDKVEKMDIRFEYYCNVCKWETLTTYTAHT